MRPLQLIFLLLVLAQSARSQLVLNTGEVWHPISSIPFQANCSEFFIEQGIFNAPIRQVARIRVKFGANILDSGESIKVGMFDNFYGVGGTNVTFWGPTNSIELLCPETWTDNIGFPQLYMLSGSVAITNISLATKYISGSGCAEVYQTNLSHLFFPGPQLTLDPTLIPFGVCYVLWPTNAVGFRLEETEMLSPPNWKPVTNLIGTLGTNYGHMADTFDALGFMLPKRFYRLRKPL